MQGDHVRGKFVKMWTRYFGGPKKLKLDLGPGFDNQFVEQMRDTLGCEIVAVPGGAHWSHPWDDPWDDRKQTWSFARNGSKDD